MITWKNIADNTGLNSNSISGFNDIIIPYIICIILIISMSFCLHNYSSIKGTKIDSGSYKELGMTEYTNNGFTCYKYTIVYSITDPDTKIKKDFKKEFPISDNGKIKHGYQNDFKIYRSGYIPIDLSVLYIIILTVAVLFYIFCFSYGCDNGIWILGCIILFIFSYLQLIFQKYSPKIKQFFGY